jgi:gliding motility-associated-like protein
MLKTLSKTILYKTCSCFLYKTQAKAFLLCFVLFLFCTINSFANGNDSTAKPIAITLNINTINSTCQKPNGKIIINASGGVLPYSYSLTHPNTGVYPQTSNVYFGLISGNYAVTVTDAIGTQASQNVILGNIYNLPVGLMTSFSMPSTPNTLDASLTLSGSSGTPPYLYSLDNINFQTSNTFTNLAGGQYYTIVRDANGCSSFTEISDNIFEIPTILYPISFGYSGNSIGCNPLIASMYFIFGNVIGGTPPYSFSIDGINFQTTPSISNLPGGTYNVTIKDANGVTAIQAETFPDYCESTFSINIIKQAAVCGINGSITATATLGSAPYQYSINDGASYQPSGLFTGLAPGGYTITVKDDLDFINRKYVVVPNNCVVVIPTTTSSTCGNSNGKIVAQASNGTPPYQYALGTGAYSSNNSFTGLAAASYVVKAKDATGAEATANTIVSNLAGAQITAADTTATTCTNNTGKIDVTTTGGKPPLQYSTNGTSFINSPSITGLGFGNYTVTVKDANGCITTKPDVIVRLNNTLSIDAGDTVKICAGKNGNTNATGNATTYTWLPTQGLSTPSILNNSASPIQTTTYYLTGTTGVCTKTDSVTVLVKPAPIPNAGQGQTICFGKNASLQAGAGQVSYAWQPTAFLNNPNAAFTDVLQPTKDITYNLSVVGANGCASLQDAQVTIKVTPPPKVFVGNDTSIAIGEPFILHAIDVNGSGFNQFAWQPFYLLQNAAAQEPLIQNIQSNTSFSVTATTAAGCVGLDSINIKVFTKPDIYVPTAFTPNADGLNDVLRAIPVGIKSFGYFTVFNRYGQRIFTTTDANKGWDGKNKDGGLYAGTYVWITQGVDFRGRVVEKKGVVVLVR